jgi:hydrogenase maturation factor
VTPTQPSSPSTERDRQCDPADQCVTCGDVAVSMRVLAIDHASGLAVCADEADRRATVEIALVLPVELEDVLLVHAGAAIARAGAEEQSPAAPGRGSTMEMPEADAEGKMFRAGAEKAAE